MKSTEIHSRCILKFVTAARAEEQAALKNQRRTPSSQQSKEEVSESLQIMAAAEGIGADAAVVAVWSRLDGIFTIKEQ